MDAVKNRDDLLSIKEEYLRRQKSYRRQVLVCGGAGCISSNCGEVRDALIKSVSTYKPVSYTHLDRVWGRWGTDHGLRQWGSL